jgi:amino acid permease
MLGSMPPGEHANQLTRCWPYCTCNGGMDNALHHCKHLSAWDQPLADAHAGATGLDPVVMLRDKSEVVAPLIEAFSLLAIATSFIGFVLGLSDFLEDALGRNRAQAYVLTLLPPYVLALAFPTVFYVALDLAGTYGVLVLFGLLPPAMAWSERYLKTTLTDIRVVDGERPVLLAVGGIAGCIICNELFLALKPMLE